MLILIIVIVAALIFAIYMGIRNRNPDIKKLKSVLEKKVGSSPEELKEQLENHKPSFAITSQNLNPKSIGQKFQKYKSKDDGEKYEVVLYFDEQHRCEDYLIKRKVEKHTYRHMMEYFHRNPEVTGYWWGQ